MTARRNRRIDITASSGAAPATARLVAAVALAAGLAAFAERVLFARAWGETARPWSAFYFGDATRFVDYAVALVQGRPYDNGIPFHPPGWPALLALFLGAAGASPGAATGLPIDAAKVFVAAISGLSVALSTVLAFEVAGIGAMIAVALVAPFHFGHVVQGTVLSSEAAYGLFVVSALLALRRWTRPDVTAPISWAVTAGALCAAAMLVRTEFLAGAVLFPAIAWWCSRGDRTREARPFTATSAAAFGVAFCLVLAPTTAWHWRALSGFNASHAGTMPGPLPRFAPVTSYGPFNFAMANHEHADGGPNRDHPMLDRCGAEGEASLGAGELDLACPAAYELYVGGYAIGARWMLAHPVAALSLVASKVANTSGFLAHGYFLDDAGSSVTGTRRRVDMLDPDGRILLPVHLLLVAGGAWVLRNRLTRVAVLAPAVVALLAATLLFYGYVRVGISYLPALWVLQGAALATLVGAGPDAGVRRPRRAVALLVSVLAIVVAVESARSRGPRRVTLDGPLTPAGNIVQDEDVHVRER